MKPSIYPIGQLPPLGQVPERMWAQVIRRERYGSPLQAFQVEEVPTPSIGPDEVLVYVMAAGVNYNNVWAAMGVPVDIIAARLKGHDPMSREPFHIGGSDASGIVFAVGERVTNVKVGDEVVAHCGIWNSDDPWIVNGGDPIVAPSNRIWGYETNFGSFAQFSKLQSHQLLPKPARLTWEQAAAYMLVGATAYRMLYGFTPNVVRQGDPVLIWGGAGGLGTQAIQIVRAAGGRPVAVISDDAKVPYCKELGAVGCINRKDFSHWGPMPDYRDRAAYDAWLEGAKAFGRAFWKALGERRSPKIVFEHPGEATLPTSMYVCENGGMVVTCAGTTGYNGVVDLRYLWMRQKRLQGSHFANDDQCAAFNQLVESGSVDPCLSRVFSFEEIPLAHQLMQDNRHPHGNMACLVGAPRKGLGAKERS